MYGINLLPPPCVFLLVFLEIRRTLKCTDLGQGEIAGAERRVTMGMREGKRKMQLEVGRVRLEASR